MCVYSRRMFLPFRLCYVYVIQKHNSWKHQRSALSSSSSSTSFLFFVAPFYYLFVHFLFSSSLCSLYLVFNLIAFTSCTVRVYVREHGKEDRRKNGSRRWGRGGWFVYGECNKERYSEYAISFYSIILKFNIVCFGWIIVYCKYIKILHSIALTLPHCRKCARCWQNQKKNKKKENGRPIRMMMVREKKTRVIYREWTRMKKRWTRITLFYCIRIAV